MKETYITSKMIDIEKLSDEQKDESIRFLARAIMKYRVVCSEARNEELDEFVDELMGHDFRVNRVLEVYPTPIVILLAQTVMTALQDKDDDKVFYIMSVSEGKILGQVVDKSSLETGD